MNIRADFEKMRAEVEENARVRAIEREALAAQKRAQSIMQVKRTQPMDQQIRELMRSVPPASLNRPWSMAELIQRLDGKYRDRPHAKQVGDALRRLGWQRIRMWTGGFDGQRVWVPVPFSFEWRSVNQTDTGKSSIHRASGCEKQCPARQSYTSVRLSTTLTEQRD